MQALDKHEDRLLGQHIKQRLRDESVSDRNPFKVPKISTNQNMMICLILKVDTFQNSYIHRCFTIGIGIDLAYFMFKKLFQLTSINVI